MTELSSKLEDGKAALMKAGKALYVPVGLASATPLWLMFTGAASAGVAYWWMSRLFKPTNLEAILEAPAPLAHVPLALAPPPPEVVVEADPEITAELEPVVEASEPDPVLESAPKPASKPKAKKASPANGAHPPADAS